jgi:hypothetical protein
VHKLLGTIERIMNIFEVGFVALTITGTVLGAQQHNTLHVGVVLGGIIGAAAGLLSAFALTFLLAAVLSLANGKPLFRPKNRDVDDA